MHLCHYYWVGEIDSFASCEDLKRASEVCEAQKHGEIWNFLFYQHPIISSILIQVVLLLILYIILRLINFAINKLY